ncbi:hypothetical protein [Uliginosibacterium flavum]|uniref:ABC transporter ATP-binding protein n=1 Tax=Uliginosibacterium flavum TaxID=1396831 RepID=A0ABV2TLF5_9RHOO
MLELTLRVALRNPLQHKLRSVLTLSGIVMAIQAFSQLGTIASAWYAGRLLVREHIAL